MKKKIHVWVTEEQQDWLRVFKSAHKEDASKCVRDGLDLLIKKKNREAKR